MKRCSLIMSVAFGLLGTVHEARSAGSPEAGIVWLTDAVIVTLDPERPRASAMAWNADGKILALGSDAEVRAVVGADSAEVIQAGGRLVLPGFVDTHVHVPEAGINESLCLLPANESISVYESLLADCALAQADQPWVRASGASLFGLRDAGQLPLEVLDRAVPDKPALVLDDLGHAVWTNSAGLRAAGIGADDADPQGGVFLRDAESGVLTGLLLEDAQHRVRNVATADDEANYAGLLLALEQLAENGVTTISDAGGYWGQKHPAAWLRAQADETLTVRAVNSLYLYPDLDYEDQLAEFARRFSNDRNSLLRFNTAKIYIDGILDLGTAAMLAPYDQPVDANLPFGFEYFNQDQLQAYVAALDAIGYRMQFHVIGDRAVRLALDAVQALNKPHDSKPLRPHRTTHTYLVDPEDMARFAELGVVADFQVGADSINPDYHEDLTEIIGERAYDMLPVSALLEAGAAVSLSSDWDADPLSPFGIIERAVTRESYAVADVEKAIGLLTHDAAYALGVSDETGSLAVGKFADFVIVDRNILTTEPDEISDAKILLTVLQGEEIYRAENYPD